MPPMVAFLAVTTAAFLLAGFVKGVTGLGLAIVPMAVLGLVMGPAEAAALLIVPILVTNLWQLAAGYSLVALLRRLWSLILAMCLGTWAGMGLLVADKSGRASIALGGALMLYAIVGLVGKRLRVPAQAERWLSPVIGAATGIVTAATGVFSIPAVPYLQALGLEKDELVQALGLSFTAATLALALNLAVNGVLQASVAGASLLAVLPAATGMLAGQWLRSRIRADVFQFYFLVALLVVGSDLALRALR